MHHIKNDAKFLKQHQNYSNLVKNKNLEISSLQSRDCEIEKNARYLENARSRDLEIKHYRVDYGGREKKKCNLTHTLEKVGNTAGDDAKVVKLTEE